MIPPVGAIGAGGLGELATGALGTSTPAGSGQLEGLGQSGALGQGEALGGPAGTGPESGFGGALTHAISSLEQTQQSADGAAQSLATGTVSDPESAIVTVENAQLAMQLAAQLRTKATEAVQQIFSTQV